MSTASPIPLHPCKWDWCRETFDTGDRLARHVLDDHVANETPIKREDIRLEMRAFDGTSMGEDSIRTSLLMNENASLDEDEKESDVPAPRNSYPIHQNAGEAEDPEQESRIEHDSSMVSAPTIPESLAAEPDTITSDHVRQSSSPSRTPSPSSRSCASSTFGELTASSSPSPDPDTMAVAPPPSLAELVAKTINNAHNSNRGGTTGPSTVTRTDTVTYGLTRPPPNSDGLGQSSRPPSTEGKRKSTGPPPGESSAPPKRTSSRPSSSNSRPVTRSRSRTSSDASRKEVPHPGREVTGPMLSLIRDDASVSQPGLQPDTQGSNVAAPAARPFRTGSLHLVPNALPSGAEDSLSSHADTAPHPRPQAKLQDGHEPSPTPDGAGSYVDDVQMLSSLDPSIPAFTQGFGAQNQSQWPLTTQAPYSIDSSLTFSSQ